MALVAYGSSDESDSDLDEEGIAPATAVLPKSPDEPKLGGRFENGVDFSDPDEGQDSTATLTQERTAEPTRTFVLPAPKNSETKSIFGGEERTVDSKEKSEHAENLLDDDVWEDDPYLNDDLVASSSSILADVPAPLVQPSELKAELPSADADDEVEDLDELKRRFAPPDEERVKKDVPVKKPVKERKPVRITVPALSQFEEEEDAEPKRKKVKPSEARSGLFDLLPPPKFETKKMSNRPLIPHTLTRPRPQPPKPPVKKPVATKVTTQVDSDEEDDGGPVDFFSLSKAEEVYDGPVDIPEEPIATVGPVLPEHHKRTKPARMPPVQQQLAVDDERAGPSGLEEPGPSETMELSEEALLQLQGANARRANKEEINLVEYRADDALSEAQLWRTKQLSEEQSRMSHSKKKKDGPSTMSRRKHQITYLAYQAKERELELKNMWAENRAARKAHQARYGF